MAVNRVEELLRRVADALDAAAVPYAMVGGNAVAAWVTTVDEGAVRATKDVDVLIRRADLPGVADALRPVGLMPVEVHGVMMFVDRRRPNPKTGVHILFADELVRPHDTHAPPDPSCAVRAAGGFLVVDLPALVAMKLQAFRNIDKAHIEDLMSVGMIEAELIAKLPPDLRLRLAEIRGGPE
jgi:hypothetical protein